MRDAFTVQTLLGLFVPLDRAESITGDLTEEREVRGSAWFWFHVFRTTFALFTNILTAALGMTLALVTLGCALFVTLAFAGLAAVLLFPFIGWSASCTLLSLFWWTAAFCTGVFLVSVAPKHGMTACVALAITSEALLIPGTIFFALTEPLKAWSILAYASALLVAVPLLAGGAIARWRRAGTNLFDHRRPPLNASLYPVLLLGVLLASPGGSSAQQSTEWHDPSPHRITLVTVDDGVQLEVLDWGGSGRAIVLLAGLGDTAHVYDDFAPMLAADYHVYGVTRRGHPGSSAPTTGYEFTRLAEDVIRVVKSLALIRPIVVGHSIAGEELHVLGGRYASEVSGLVYLDAAFNRTGGSKEYDTVAGRLPPAPAPGAKDLASITALRAFRMKIEGAALPEAHLRARYVVNADGSAGRAWIPALPIRQAFTSEIRRISESYDPERIRVPALAIYAVPKSPADLIQPWYAADDPVLRQNVDSLYRLARERFQRHAEWFQKFAERGRVSEIPGAHHLFITNAGEVLRQIKDFVSSLPEGTPPR